MYQKLDVGREGQQVQQHLQPPRGKLFIYCVCCLPSYILYMYYMMRPFFAPPRLMKHRWGTDRVSFWHAGKVLPLPRISSRCLLVWPTP